MNDIKLIIEQINQDLEALNNLISKKLNNQKYIEDSKKKVLDESKLNEINNYLDMLDNTIKKLDEDN